MFSNFKQCRNHESLNNDIPKSVIFLMTDANFISNISQPCEISRLLEQDLNLWG